MCVCECVVCVCVCVCLCVYVCRYVFDHNYTRKMVPIKGELGQSLKKFLCTYIRLQKQNRKEKEETEQQQTYQFIHKVITFSTDYKYTTSP